jgi:hypothetical protein
MSACSTRSGGNSGFVDDRIAQVRADVEQLVLNPRQRGRDLLESSCPSAIATPIEEFASSVSAYAISRGSVFEVLLMSPSRVEPSSPVRV